MGQRGHCKSRGLYFFYGNVNEKHQLGTGFFGHYRKISAVKRVEFVSNRMMSYIVLRGRWCIIVVLNVLAPSEEKRYITKGSFYKELELVFDHFPKKHMNIPLGDFNEKLGRHCIVKPTIWKEGIHQDCNDNGVRIVNFAT